MQFILNFKNGKNMNYKKLLKLKTFIKNERKIKIKTSELNKNLFDWQKVFVKWALLKGKACFFTQCGTGKTLLQLSWANQIYEKTNKNVIIITPLAVTDQTIKESKKFNFKNKINKINEMGSEKKGINIINYEKLHKLNYNFFDAIVLDESSILKSFTGKIKNSIIDNFKHCEFKLACSATPSPNDYTELGNHSEFLDIMSFKEMLSTFFINDTKMIHNKWRLKKHSTDDFWKWVCSWAIMMEKPSDLGFKNNEYKLPKLNIHNCIIDIKGGDKCEIFPNLYNGNSLSFSELRKERKKSIKKRVEYANKIIIDNNLENCLIWVELNDEGKYANKIIEDSMEVSGSTNNDLKIKYMSDFSDNKLKYLISKPKIAGFGMNWQNCQNCIFVGPSYSYEMFYQAMRRIYRFGQKKDVNVWLICTAKESNVLKILKEKEKKYKNFYKNMIKYYNFNKKNLNTYDEFYSPEKKFEIPQF